MNSDYECVKTPNICTSAINNLTLFNAVILEGIPQKLEHNDIKWIAPSEIPNYEFCPADVEILKKITEVFRDD